MKTKLVIHEKEALLVLEAETTFEREMLRHVDSFKTHHVEIVAEHRYGVAVSGSLTVRFDTSIEGSS